MMVRECIKNNFLKNEGIRLNNSLNNDENSSQNLRKYQILIGCNIINNHF